VVRVLGVLRVLDRHVKGSVESYNYTVDERTPGA